MTRIQKILWAWIFMLMGVGAAVYLHWPALTNPLVYKSDVRQSPHWSAYHTDSFREDDLIVRLGAYNESPVQNLIYYIGTYMVDMVTLGKWIAVISYGLIAALFFWLGHSMLGFRGGAIASIFITFFPDQFEYCAGGFSKMWMIPLILCCVYFLEKKYWYGLFFIMPFGAAAYPVCAVFIGAVALFFLILEIPENGEKILRPLGILCIASVLAVTVLLIKYLFPPDYIGALTPGYLLRKMPEMYRGGMYHYLPLPTLTQEVTKHLAHPFILFSAVVFLICLGHKGTGWTRVMTAMVLASVIFYLIARIMFMDLYQPNRYTRYSIAVLLALWQARNWDRILALLPWRIVQTVALVSMLCLGGYLYKDTFRIGKDTSPREEWAPLNRFIATLPDKILVAGHPKYMDDIPIQARRSVLCNYKMAHPWYSKYYAEIRQRTLATFDALYAGDFEPANLLFRKWGVTHLVVVKRYMSNSQIQGRKIYVNPYNEYIVKITRKVREFAFSNPPPENIVYEDKELYVIALPINDKDSSGDKSSSPMPGSAGEDNR
ncbi:MAG: hypothetical protein A2161_16530 [Candidatus Schekmanbacteria bacterium RBG_13_48_7]|uniref:Glycosyltransferase RgtA/B/C/D-like domain-containing protein n=1 Tax=Candidatus Schekmanbacteria bacterium RBG_13_48_7 TaxID=1817878 RepID=A0A1F7RWE0_9BACT|nr:MAG: hypothetical protein A2161_16530 [Candidatus Schekmanbacteria bacterium RBG_13_48_7]